MPRSALTLLLAALLVAATGAVADDPLLGDQYGLHAIRAPDAWPVSRGGGIRIAIVDTGIDLAHPDLATRLVRRPDGSVLGRDFVEDGALPQDRNGHGTLVAGIAAAEAGNGIGIAGVAPAARLMPLRVLDADGTGNGSDVEEAIRWAVDNGAHVINLSLESALPLPGGLLSTAPVDAVRYAWERGVVVVAAAGNSGAPFTDYPSGSPVLLVGATDRDDQRASFSDSGRSDGVMAPGVDIISTWCGSDEATCDGATHTYGEATGTSFAAPHVSAAVALLLASGYDHEGAVQRLRETARDLGSPGPDASTGYGLIDVVAALAGTAPPPAPPPAPSPAPSPPPPTAPAPAAAPTAPPPAPSPAPSPPAVSEPPALQAAPSPAPGSTGAGDAPALGPGPAPTPTATAPTGAPGSFLTSPDAAAVPNGGTAGPSPAPRPDLPGPAGISEAASGSDPAGKAGALRLLAAVLVALASGALVAGRRLV